LHPIKCSKQAAHQQQRSSYTPNHQWIIFFTKFASIRAQVPADGEEV
jgi:hypothetical protein